MIIGLTRTHARDGGSAPATPGFNAVAPEWLSFGAASAAPAFPAAESTLGSHPCVALSSAQVSLEWINFNLAVPDFSSNGDHPLTLLSHPRGALQSGVTVAQNVGGLGLAGDAYVYVMN
jgi:hypothetical protein